MLWHCWLGVRNSIWPVTRKPPQGGWQTSPPACTACCSPHAVTITGFSLGQRGDKRQWIPVVSTHKSANWGSSEGQWPWPWPWIRLRSHQHAQYIQDYQHARTCDCSLKQYGNMAIWNSCNIDIPQSLNSCDSFLGRKFENRAPTGCRLCPVLSWSTISFELHAKTAEEIDLDQCNFRKFKSPVTLTLDRIKVISAYTIHAGLPACPTVWLYHQAIRKYGHLKFV